MRRHDALRPLASRVMRVLSEETPSQPSRSLRAHPALSLAPRRGRLRARRRRSRARPCESRRRRGPAGAAPAPRDVGVGRGAPLAPGVAEDAAVTRLNSWWRGQLAREGRARKGQAERQRARGRVVLAHYPKGGMGGRHAATTQGYISRWSREGRSRCRQSSVFSFVVKISFGTNTGHGVK